MRVLERRKGLALTAAVFLAVLLTMGCAASIKYSYDTKTSFPGKKTYAWSASSAMYKQDALLEANIQTVADQLLAQKGFARVPDRAELMVSMSYEFESSIYQYSYQLRALTLNVYDNKDVIWRGTAFGCIKTDAASGGLKQAVEGILSNFPPK